MSNRNCHLRDCDRSYADKSLKLNRMRKLFRRECANPDRIQNLGSHRKHDPMVTKGRSMGRVFCGNIKSFHPHRGNGSLFFSFA